ncbi:hypothetical protein IQ37_05040 [Chryseobacterium piperi]|uniref:Glycosyl transferase family 1 domain-containing protein n=1 Tax=Chryseobacterium piperi TaxID=558152 RepID=A0A086BKX6_9FLAO|nr:hypothetical protein [Chryseobacterium piperi]ASW74431.1 hypothetical protein CJF12_09095 [Chryseobacterium piperi]KFF29590.1 hypothetical protein IQ37_05040 [Chryseobacterium piperi]
MKKIAYIEIDTHAEIAQAFMNVMKGSHEFEVDYYFSKKIKDQVKVDGEAVFLSDSSMISDQLKTKPYEVVIIGTVHRYFNTFLSIVQKYNTAVITHNLNFPQSSKLNLIKSIFKEDLIYRLKLWLKEGLFYSPKVYRHTKNLLVLDVELSSEKYKFLPLFYTENFVKPDNKEMVVVIPGGVSQKRRNYKHIFKTIENLKSPEPYTFVFLGKAEGKELRTLEALSGQVPENIRLKYFKERVSADDYEVWMQKANILWCPIQDITTFFSQKEVYGKTKMTGNVGDAIKYGKIAVFPENYPSQLSFILSEKENVIEQFQQLQNHEFDFQKFYSREMIRENLEKVLNSLITI